MSDSKTIPPKQLGSNEIAGIIFGVIFIILVLIVQISGNKKIMNSRANGKFAITVGWTITGLMVLVGVATLAILIFPK